MASIAHNIVIPGRAQREPGISRFRVWSGACHRAAQGADPLGPSRNDRGSIRMILPALFFYLFAGICVASAVMVIVSRNPVHSVLFLILAFVNAAGLFILMGAEFLGMVLVVVYVG